MRKSFFIISRPDNSVSLRWLTILPERPGVYLMRGQRKELLYVGKALNLRRRVSSYFMRPHDTRIQNLVSLIRCVEYRPLDSALEALVVEAEYIKSFQPPYNIRDKDGKSFLYVEITNDEFPQVRLVRGKGVSVGHPGFHNGLRKNEKGRCFGPFTSASAIRVGMKILRKIFPYNVHSSSDLGKAYLKPCFDYQVGLCPGTCVRVISKKDYRRIIRSLILFFEGRKSEVLSEFHKEMEEASRGLDFEKAGVIKRRIFALQHIQDVAFSFRDEIQGSEKEVLQRIEGYDVSNISGSSGVGVMVVFLGEKPEKSEYRLFRIRSVKGANDVASLEEVLRRRFRHSWDRPSLLLIDGGRGQVNVARKVLREVGLEIPVVGLAKGPSRRKIEFVGTLPRWVNPKTLMHVRDEAHRFAISYHRRVRGKAMYN